jgi:hypothetical protein
MGAPPDVKGRCGRLCPVACRGVWGAPGVEPFPPLLCCCRPRRPRRPRPAPSRMAAPAGEAKVIVLRTVGGEIGAAASLAPKVGPLGLVRVHCAAV